MSVPYSSIAFSLRPGVAANNTYSQAKAEHDTNEGEAPWTASVATNDTSVMRRILSRRRLIRVLVYSSALLFFVGTHAPRAAEIDQNPLVGTWLLVKYVDTPENSEPIFAFGKKPVGHFIFTAGGHAAFSIMRNPPDTETPTSDPDPDACFPGWYCAYFGTYTVDAKNGVWVTHVLSANIPKFLNTDQLRHFKIDGDRLVVAETYLNGGTRIKAERVFVRESLPSPRL